jgi:3-oxoacyl-[acyl-carrier protein] reductase
MEMGLKGAKAIVTAASQGLGAATARQLSLEGAEVVITSRSLAELQTTASEINEETGNPVYTIAGDVTDDSANRRIITHAAEMLGGLDVLVVNAGGPPAGDFTDFDDLGVWEAATRLTLFSAVSLIQAALPYLKQSLHPAILAIVSVAAKQPVNHLTLSNTLRPAVVGLTKTLSVEFAPMGIRVNSILPGMTDTARMTKLLQARADRNFSDIETERQHTTADIPLKRFGEPQEFGCAAAFLCSPAAGFITGVALPVDGGTIRATL